MEFPTKPIIALRTQCRQNAGMTIQLTIREVPEAVRNELAARAAREGRSMQEYLKRELERLASRPTTADWIARVRERKTASGTRLRTRDILSARAQDKR